MSKAPLSLRRPNMDDDRAWLAYWEEQHQPWRTEPEIDVGRQQYLEEHLTVKEREWERYPFKDIVLDRADVEWLLANYADGRRFAEQSYQLLHKRSGLDLRGVDLRKVDLHGLPLQGVDLYNAHLEGTDLRAAHLEGADLSEAHLEGGNLSGAFFTSVTNLKGIHFGNEKSGFVLLAGVRWSDVDLSVVVWTQMNILGDEYQARRREKDNGEAKDSTACLEEYRTAVRANRQLAVALQGEGLNEEAARYAYRAQ